MRNIFKLNNIKKEQIIEGIPGNWFLKHFAAVLIILLFSLCYISVRFDCVTAMETVQKLSRRLEVTRTDVQRERSMYMSATCESSMQQMVDSLGLGLQIQERPPYKLSLR
ncbi:MAG: FtsL-like putative cell division protein [Odoribacter sp.]|nr:FtsL-like putative cell division protein [Odoribacter sp.]